MIHRNALAGVLAALLPLTACSDSADAGRLKKENDELRADIAGRDRQIATLQERLAQPVRQEAPLIDTGTTGIDPTTDDNSSSLTPLQLPEQTPPPTTP